MRQPDKKIVTATYAPDRAGEQIGWVSVVSRSNVGQLNVDTVEVNVGVTNISDKGAHRGHTERHISDEEKRRIVFANDVAGFIATSSLRLEIVKGVTVAEFKDSHPIDLTHSERQREASDEVADAAELDEVEWVEGSEDIVTVLKEKLASNDVEEFYPIAYYGLNAAIGHAGVRGYIGNLGRATNEIPSFVADSEMNETTWWQLAGARSIAVSLGQIIEEDVRIQKDLTAFDLLDKRVIPRSFRASREIVHAAEARASKVANQKLIIPRHVFLPTGFRPSGRTWPYMDAAMGVNDERAFGAEMAALQNKDAAPANRELKREINETALRVEYAQAAVHMLRGLHGAEKNN